MDLILQPGGPLRLGNFLISHLADTSWVEFRGAVAFVKYSGLRHIAKALVEFARRGRIRISVGVDLGGTTLEGLKALLDCVGSSGEVWVYHNENGSTFHPKLFMFMAARGIAEMLVGSGNLTEGGLFTNYEIGLAMSLDPADAGQARTLRDAVAILDTWCDPSNGAARRLDPALLQSLLDSGYIVREGSRRPPRPTAAPATASGGAGAPPRALFPSTAVPRAPAAPRWPLAAPPLIPAGVAVEQEPAEEPSGVSSIGFLMTLQRTDVGVGQVSANTSRRSPEIFIPLAARDFAPDFWGWPTQFSADASKPGKMDRRGVRMWLGSGVIEVNMMTWPAKHDFRLRCEALRSAGSVGDILRLERADSTRGFEYTVSIIVAGTPEHQRYLPLCTNRAAGGRSNKLWGYY